MIPQNWSSQGVDHPFTYEAGAKDIWINKPDDPPYHAPHVKGLFRCGVSADYIYMTTNYIMDEAIADQYGPRKKVRLLLTEKILSNVYSKPPECVDIIRRTS